ncbi:TetR/AcrR family transcriptional regulator C-terminal domain-containing protein, partial [Kitasatospora sp. NPDC048722]|uniref:TetR/AcrR family transcriptional regulator C-terminal domain-containing protein n=1 Tax=Kitasatospora sp. NPDC048722 TaxID=3155639 RepID=UPI0033E27605
VGQQAASAPAGGAATGRARPRSSATRTAATASAPAPQRSAARGGHRRLLLDNRDAAKVVAGRLGLGPHMLAILEDQLDRLREAGFSNSDAAMVSYLLGTFVQGFVLQEQAPVSAAETTGNSSRRDAVDAAADRFRSLPAAEFPTLVELAGDLTEPDMDARFEFCVARVLDGVATLLPPEPR